ncbi:MAG: response regulator transcription factor [Deltaproteobacteria bacterium]|nr:response regulator transcription factor [Deltaproteobacteria bacterium]
MLFSGEALRIYRDRREEIDLVILDLIIPDMAGGETYDHLKRINPGVKVLLSSGYSINGRAREMLDRGCDGFIQKPFDLAELSGRVRSILDGK